MLAREEDVGWADNRSGRSFSCVEGGASLFATFFAFPWHFHHRRDDMFNGREFPVPPRRRPDLRPSHPAHLVAPGRTSSRPVAPRAAPHHLVTPRLPAPRSGRLVHSSEDSKRVKVLNALYVLNQAPRLCHESINGSLLSHGFRR
jgi:hypothetical protein